MIRMHKFDDAPQKNDTGHTFDDNFVLLASAWSSVFLLLGLLMVSMLLDHVRGAFQTATSRRQDQPIGVRYLVEGTEHQPSQQQQQEQQQYGPRGDDDRRMGVDRGQERVPLLREAGIVTRGEVTLPHEWSLQLDKATQLMQTLLTILLVATVLLSIPIAVSCDQIQDGAGNMLCARDDDHKDPVIPGPPPIPPLPSPPTHGRCMTNAMTVPAVVLSWIYAALSIVWWALTLVRFPEEGFCARSAASDVTKIVIALASFPSVLWMAYFGLLRWVQLKSSTC